nr:hypothetical protein [uncultured Psychroserpens sp.]
MKHIRKSKFSKILASYLAIQLIVTSVQPNSLWALTGGPSQPEFNAFTPIGTSDMVNLSTGDFNYNIPIMDVGGYPLNLAYNSGITMDQEASWVGLGWNLNVGQINRQVRGLPDDFNGDEVTYEDNLKKNKTVGLTLSINGQVSGAEFLPGQTASATLMHNNYEGFSFTPSYGVSYKFASGTSVGMNLTSSVEDGVSVTPTATQSFNDKKVDFDAMTLTSITDSYGAGITYNSRQGITAFNINSSTTKEVTDLKSFEDDRTTTSSEGGGASVSFIDNTFTPSKRTPYHNENYTFRATLGPDAWPFSFEAGASAFYSIQRLKNKVNVEKAFGYEFTKNATHNDILDFNRENERTVSKNTLVLPTVNYTYDLYNIKGQGIGGQYRPFKSQVGYLFGQNVVDDGDSFTLGAEIEGGAGFHVGVDIQYSPTISSTGVWDIPVTNKFKSTNNNALDYEETYFKPVGGLSVDDDQDLYENKLQEESPMALDLIPDGEKVYGKKAVSRFNVKKYSIDDQFYYTQTPITGYLKRAERRKRNQSISKITKQEAVSDPFVLSSSSLKNHHTNGVRVLQTDGSTYVYGEAAVNTTKKEVAFATNANANITTLQTGTTPVNGQDSPSNSSGVDNYFNRITTPEYAHTYLLSSVLSSDYEDLTGDGITDDDLGAYTKFYYDNQNVNSNNYKWRVPLTDASYNPGLYTKTNDQKASYIYGEKELKYLSKIETKTHIAFFDLSPRKDGYGVDGNGGLALSEPMFKIDKIRLYSKPEYKLHQFLLEDENLENDPISPIKTVHFEYNYSLCGAGLNTAKLPNNSGVSEFVDGVDINANAGKLTLKKVFFTYRGSEMGRYTPYVFNYDNPNPEYQMKSYDVWANYKPLFEDGVTLEDTNQDGTYDDFSLPTINPPLTSCEVNYPITAQEFPFVDQNNKELQDLYVSAWTLSSIDLPSGGNIELQYESDDYKHVQDRAAMQMFKVVGVNNDGSDQWSNKLYGLPTGEAKYLVVELLEDVADASEFEEKYVGEFLDKPLFYRFLLNMEKTGQCGYDYVEGYCNIDQNAPFKYFSNPNNDGKNYGAIPIEHVDIEGGVVGNNDVNPISKSGWYFARKHLNRYAYGTGDNSPTSINLGDIVNAIGATLPLLAEIFIGPNAYLKGRNIAKTFKPEKSWIRLKHPTDGKLGGGLRVKKLVMHDNWDVMINNEQSNAVNPYSNFYGQEYNYTLENSQGSSGVATWEPNMSKENPFIEPIYDNHERLSAHEYVEKPLGVSFFPAPLVTYSRVEVSNLSREHDDGSSVNIVKKHATGKVVSEFFTSKNFPTIADYTEIEDKNNYVSNESKILDNVLRLNVLTELVLSQGFSVVTNDMNGKMKRQTVFDEASNLVSGVDYKYNVDADSRLVNKLPVVMQDGSLENKIIGVDYDVITDFNKSYNLSEVYGVDTNATFFVIPLPIPLPILLGQLPFEYKRNESTLHTTTTTKVVHKSGILKEKIAYDLGSSVSTRNLAWDAISGQVLLTETINEYEDNYYNFNYPAHWSYKGMGQASKNLGITCWLTPMQSTPESTEDNEGATAWYQLRDYTTDDLTNYFSPGDELIAFDNIGNVTDKYWIIQTTPNAMVLIDSNGQIANPCGENEDDVLVKVVRSNHRNLQTASMASVTSMINPLSDSNTNDDYVYDTFNLDDFNYNGTGVDPRIINASAVEYYDFWMPQRENNQNVYPRTRTVPFVDDLIQYPRFYVTNPFLNNIKGDWRAVKSYAHLTGRSAQASSRSSGFFTSFSPFYKYNESTLEWEKDDQDWTFASEVTKYSPFGAELENKDALNRHSAAQYGYNYTLPVAVASNSEYREIGFDGFEDYSYVPPSYSNSNAQYGHKNSHFGYQSNIDNSSSLITTETAHTGKFSIKVLPSTSISMKKIFEEHGKCDLPTIYSTLCNDPNSEYSFPPYDLDPEFDCSSFYPKSLEWYVLSGWVKEDVIKTHTYTNDIGIEVSFRDIDDNDIASIHTVTPVGNIIDGWQRIIGKFRAPLEPADGAGGGNYIEIKLFNNSLRNAWFDDIRVYPVNGSMKSFVYDQDTQRLMAELDENNFATYYEYDQEGGLVRVKKETEKGVYTIQETRSSTSRKN